MTELQHLHRAFGHSSVDKLAKLLEKADPSAQSDLRKSLEEIASGCEPCQLNSAAPRRFKLSCRLDDELRFDAEAGDLMYIRNIPMLHLVCTHTHFQAASFVESCLDKGHLGNDQAHLAPYLHWTA